MAASRKYPVEFAARDKKWEMVLQVDPLFTKYVLTCDFAINHGLH